MAETSDQFITHMKLRELRGQRALLLQTYTRLQQQVAQEPVELERLRLLYDGLRRTTFSHHPLHPDIANLEPLLDDLPTDQASLETVTFWHNRLEQELASGQVSSEMVYLFGAEDEGSSEHKNATSYHLSIPIKSLFLSIGEKYRL